MHLLIDGYNLLKTIEQTLKINRDSFIALLNSYANKKKHQIMIVFDGGPAPIPTTERREHLKVVYAGAKTADEIIQEVLDLYEDESNIVLISSDMQLKHYAKLRHIVAIDSQIFKFFLPLPQRIIKKKDYSAGQTIKLESNTYPELDELMHLDIKYVKDEDLQLREETKNDWLKELAGNDKQLIRILKKL